MNRAGLTRWLQDPPATGRLSLLWSIVAVGVPTIIRAAVNGVVTGCEFTPYLPFVLLSAILLPWRQASIVALLSVAILGGLFVGPPSEFFVSKCFLSGAGIFLASSAMMIGIVLLIRRIFAATQLRGVDESAGGIVFSVDKGRVWASWYGSGPPVPLGSQIKVSAKMQDFLAQAEHGKGLKELPDLPGARATSSYEKDDPTG